ncbi:MAG: molecular chaperone DnaJ [Alphaproteobacteria bacterium]|nr:MAG: molecular chaperone DnaJ [Alphaproteobacteria bacterium]
MSKDYYARLGITQSADAAQIKKAYRSLAMKCHPDRNPGDAEAEKKFKEINKAYEILSDPQKRAHYDQFGSAAFDGSGGGSQPGGGFGFDFGQATGGFSFEDVFHEFMGGGTRGGNKTRKSSGQRGSDLRYDVSISLEEAFRGLEQTITIPAYVSCESCSGSGAKEGAKPTSCGSCHGSGTVRAQQGFFTVERSCPTCNGEGSIIENPCIKCHGHGRTRKQRTLKISIPAGVEDGTRIRLSGEGEAGYRGGGHADLYIFVSIRPHQFIQREGADIHCEIPVSITTATLGGEIEIPTIDGGKARVTIPEGTQANQKFRLKSKGMPIIRRDLRGDMYIHTRIDVPTKLTKRQKELLTEFAEIEETSKSKGSSFFDKLKNLWSSSDAN